MNNYKLGKTKSERHIILKEIIQYYENNMSLEEISNIYGVSKQAISLNMTKNGYYPARESKKIKRHKINNNILVGQNEEIINLRLKIKSLKIYNCLLRRKIKELENNIK